MKDKFIAWMKTITKSNGKNYEDSTISRYVRALEKLCSQINGLNIESTNLFFYKDFLTFKKVEAVIRGNSDFERVNRASNNGNGDLSASMSRYREFLKESDKAKQPQTLKIIMSNKEMLAHVKNYIKSKGYIYNDQLLDNYYLCLKAKPFVLLAGVSGTGKSKLVELFAEACGATDLNGRFLLVPVRPDWSDSSDLFGHTDLYGKFIVGDVLEFIKRASENLQKPFFLCLDEMNLARVEYYFSDFLSVIETRKKDLTGKIRTKALISENTCADKAKIYGGLQIPENLYVIGTVNMDETTFPFSRKVLDRANTIEFSEVTLTPSDDNNNVGEAEQLDVDNDFLKSSYLQLPNEPENHSFVMEVCRELDEINRVLKRVNAHVAYRVRDELVSYMVVNRKEDLMNRNEAMDYEILQKILPRLQGSSFELKRVLCDLFGICATTDYEGSNDISKGDISESMRKELIKLNDDKKCKYPLCADKVVEMVRRFEEDGFTSYWA